MLKDNQLSTVLLLVALGFLIYFLTKPKTVSEEFAEEEKAVPESTRDEDEVDSTPETRPAAEVRPEVLKQILAEAESPRTEAELPRTEAELPRAEINSDQMDVFQYEPNDVQESGADLDAAFQRPVPQQARPDVVDINKNNVKKYNAKDFLPKEINNQWFDTDFSQAKFNINDDKLINTERYVIGINTVGQSLKNASYDIRGTIPNPKFTISPWNNSTYEPDFNLKPLC
jgi:type IV secretory pathway VirB10-like protein